MKTIKNFKKTQVRTINQTNQDYPKPSQSKSIDLFSYANALKNSATKGHPLQWKQLHSPIFKLGYHNDLSLQNQLLSFYWKCNDSSNACKLFDEMHLRNVVTWNTLIRDLDMGLCYFKRMLWEKVIMPDSITYLNLLHMSIEVGKIEMGRQFHCCIVKWGFCEYLYVNSCLADLYAKFGFVREARRVFDEVLIKDLVLWNVMVSCYALNGLSNDGFKVFRMMRSEGIKGDEFTYTSLVNCCASLAYYESGKQIHCLVLRFGFDREMVVASALIDMYAKNENIIDARKVFDDTSPRNVILWNTMIVGYGQCSDAKEAMKLLMEMLREEFCPDELTLASVISSCGNLSLSEIRELHSYALKNGSLWFLSVSNAIVNAYSKSGDIASGFKIFISIDKPDLVSYTCMIQAFAFHGLSRNAIELFKKMVSKGVSNPDKIMFLGVLSACSHGGLVSEGLHYFESMTRDYDITPELEHYTCIVDLLGRAGLLNEAKSVVISMPMPAGPDTLGAFLGHCKVHRNLELAKWAGEKLFVLEPDKNANYALISNTFAYSRRWFDVAEVRKKMRDNCCVKVPGFSWLEVAGKVHGFVSKDEAHPEWLELYSVLGSLYNSIALNLVSTD